MKAYGIDPEEDNCCPGHAKYGRRGQTPKGIKRPRTDHKDRPRKKKAREENRVYVNENTK